MLITCLPILMLMPSLGKNRKDHPFTLYQGMPVSFSQLPGGKLHAKGIRTGEAILALQR